MRRQQTDILRIMIIVMAGLIALFAIVGGIYLVSASKKLKAVELSPDFAGNELEVGTQYSFTVNATPKKASLKKLDCEVSDSTCSFEYDADTGKAVLTTGLNTGTVSVCVSIKDIKSSVLEFTVKDSVAEAQAQAEAQAAAEEQARLEAEAAQAAEEAAASQTKYVKCTAEDVRVRQQNNTDCDILGKAKNGEIFQKVEDVDDWTHIIFQGQDAYIKSEYLVEVSEEEAQAAESASSEEDTKQEETKKEEKKEEEKKEETANTEAAATQTREEAEAKAAADAAAAAAAEAQALLEAAAAQQAAAATTLTTIHCKDGDCYVTPAQVQTIHATWDFAGDAIEMAGHHSIGELEAVVGPVTRK